MVVDFTNTSARISSIAAMALSPFAGIASDIKSGKATKQAATAPVEPLLLTQVPYRFFET
jgi:hypothetical protein